jgi:hypothetical protein
MLDLMKPMLALAIWTLMIWVWMYVTRIPAMQAAGIKPQDARHKGVLDQLPSGARQVNENYNHLHEQPTIFYALAVVSHLSGPADGLQAQLAWAYVAARVAHSLVQCTINVVVLRFSLFAVGTLILMAMAARAALLAFG